MTNEDQTPQEPEGSTPPPNADPSFGMPEAPPQNLPAVPAGKPTRPPVAVGERGIQISNLAELAQFSRMTYESGLAPKSFKNVQSVAVAVQKGMEHGLTPLAALSSVYVVNGMPAWTGKAALGLVRSSGLMAPGSYRVWFEGSGDDLTAYCESQRVGERVVKTGFSVGDAKAAKLWGKRGQNGSDTPWITYPKRMLQWKAISHHMNDAYPDVLGGMPIAEDVIDVNSTPAEPRKSLLLAVPGGETQDKLLQAAIHPTDPNLLLTPPKTEAAMAAAVAEEDEDFAKLDEEKAKAESRFRDLLAAMDDAEDFADLERKTFKALTAAGQNKAWEKEVSSQAKRLAKKFPIPKQ